VAILSRCYKSRQLPEAQTWTTSVNSETIDSQLMPKVVSDGKQIHLKAAYAGDEPYMLAKNLQQVSVIVDKDRVKGARFAIQELHSDTLLLDDGLQFLDLAHSLDIILVDANNPFGTGSILPRGTLREPIKNLCRADYIFITKCKQAGNTALIEKIRKFNTSAEIIECTHGPIHLENVFTGEIKPLEYLSQKYIAALSAIAVPESFEEKLQALGSHVVFHKTFSDHHNFHQGEIDRFMERCLRRDVDIIVTTEKDAVRFLHPSDLHTPVYFLRIEVDILSGQSIWNNLVERICSTHPPTDSLLLRQLTREV